MLNYKQIWHGIKPIRWLNKFNLTLRNSNHLITHPSWGILNFVGLRCQRYARGMNYSKIHIVAMKCEMKKIKAFKKKGMMASKYLHFI